MKVAAIAVAALVSCSCGWAPFEPGPGTEYTVTIDSAFSPDLQYKAIGALIAWEEAVPVHFTLRVAADCGTYAGNICIFADTMADVRQRSEKPEAAAVTYPTGHPGDGGAIFYGVDLDKPEQSCAFAHEIGHALGLGHTADPDDLMYPFLHVSITGPTADDVEQWYHVRGQISPTN